MSPEATVTTPSYPAVTRLFGLGAPDQELARRRYDRLAATYDLQLRVLAPVLEPVRARAVMLLRLRRGATVLDVGCGTGASLPALVEAVGPAGRVVGVEQSGEMLARCRQRIDAAGWQNVSLLEAPAQEVVIPTEADAALFFFTHDILRSSGALANVLAALGPGGRVVAAGGKSGPWWLAPVNLAVWFAARRYVTTLEGIERPWSLLAPRLVGLEVESRLLGFVYIAGGAAPASGPGSAP